MKERFLNKKVMIGLVLCLLPIVFYLPFYGELPDPMPSHFNSQGVADGYVPKAVAVFLLPLGLAAIHLFTLFMTFNDPKRPNTSVVMKKLIVWIIPVLSVAVNLMVLLYALNKPVNISIIMGTMVGVLLVIIGNYLPKCRQNYTVGIKLPWTLNSTENWDKTHRMGGWCFIAAGLLLCLCAAFGLGAAPVIAVVAVCVLVPMVYSYILFKRGI